MESLVCLDESINSIQVYHLQHLQLKDKSHSFECCLYAWILYSHMYLCVEQTYVIVIYMQSPVVASKEKEAFTQ